MSFIGCLYVVYMSFIGVNRLFLTWRSVGNTRPNGLRSTCELPEVTVASFGSVSSRRLNIDCVLSLRLRLPRAYI